MFRNSLVDPAKIHTKLQLLGKQKEVILILQKFRLFTATDSCSLTLFPSQSQTWDCISHYFLFSVLHNCFLAIWLVRETWMLSSWKWRMYGKREVMQLLRVKHHEGAQWAEQRGHPSLWGQLLFWGISAWVSITGHNEGIINMSHFRERFQVAQCRGAKLCFTQPELWVRPSPSQAALPGLGCWFHPSRSPAEFCRLWAASKQLWGFMSC